MESVATKVLVIFLVVNNINAKLNKGEKYCEKFTNDSFKQPQSIVGTWGVYYIWNQKKISCEPLTIELAHKKTKTRLASAFRKRVRDKSIWYSDMLMVSGGLELFLFPDGNDRGGFRALTNIFLLAFSVERTFPLVRYAVRPFESFNFMILLNCEKFSGYLLARTKRAEEINDPAYNATAIVQSTTVKPIVGLKSAFNSSITTRPIVITKEKIKYMVDRIMPKEKGRFVCLN
nr:uncharacterized protein LOC128679395 [Plodia interpunctella]